MVLGAILLLTIHIRILLGRLCFTIRRCHGVGTIWLFGGTLRPLNLDVLLGTVILEELRTNVLLELRILFNLVNLILRALHI